MKPQILENPQLLHENDSNTELVAYGSTTIAVSQHQFVSTCFPPPVYTFIYCCNLSSCPVSFSGSSHQDNKVDINKLLKGTAVDQQFYP